MNNLIEPELVSLQQLANIFKNAFVKVLKQSEDRIVLSMDDEKVLIEITPEQNRCSMFIMTSVLPKHELSSIEEEINALIRESNRDLISNRFSFEYNDVNMGVLVSDRDIFYSFGLNPPQLIDDIRRFIKIYKSVRDKLVLLIQSKGLIS